MYCRDTRSEKTGTGPRSTPGAIMTICSRTTRIGTSIPQGDNRSRVQIPVAITTVPAVTSVPSVSRTPVARSPSRGSSVIAVPCRMLAPAPRAPRRDGQRLRCPVGVTEPAARLVGEGGERFQIRVRPHRRDVGGVDLLGLHADGTLGGQALAQRVHVRFADSDDIAGLAEVDVVSEDLLGILEHVEPDGRHRRQGTDAVVAPDDAGGLARHPRPDGVALDDQHVGDTALGQGPCGGRALDAAADDDDVCGFRHGRPALFSCRTEREPTANYP